MIKKSRFFICLCIMLITSVIFAGCGVSQASQSSSSSAAPSTTVTSSSSVASKINLADGIYTAKFTTDSSMFHVNEANNSMGTLTVKNGQATIHVSLASKGIVNLFAGLAEDAKKEGANILEPTNDEILAVRIIKSDMNSRQNDLFVTGLSIFVNLIYNKFAIRTS